MTVNQRREPKKTSYSRWINIAPFGFSGLLSNRDGIVCPRARPFSNRSVAMGDSSLEFDPSEKLDGLGKHESQSRASDDSDNHAGQSTFAPITAEEGTLRPNYSRTNSRHSKNLDRCWSLSDGYSVGGGQGSNYDDEDKTQEPAADGTATEPSEFVVGWDENDPMNPRNMSLARRWTIAIIVSLGSICV